MRTAFHITVAVVCSAACVAQNDKITWTDGSKAEKVTVTGFNLREVVFKNGNLEERKSADRVRRLDIAKIKDKYRQAQSGTRSDRLATYLQLAERYESEPFVAQFGYFEAATMLIDAGEYGDGFAMLEELSAKCPDSGFVPLLFREKIDYYIANDKKEDAATVAKKYSVAAQTQGYPAGFVIEASYYSSLTAGLNGELQSEQLRKAMAGVVSSADPNYPDIAGRAKLQIANLLRNEGKSAEAKADFIELIDDKKSTDDLRSAAWLGLAHVHSGEGNPAAKEPYREALLAFLRVYLSEEATDSQKAEALYFGSQVAKKWGGERSGFYANVMHSRLRNHYPDSPWNSK